jgi:hypothetical protein
MLLYTEKQLEEAWQENCEEEMEKFMLGEYD